MLETNITNVSRGSIVGSSPLDLQPHGRKSDRSAGPCGASGNCRGIEPACGWTSRSGEIPAGSGPLLTPDYFCRVLGGRRAGSQWMATCPAHDDKNPSLAVREDNGKILLRCHAGCSQHEVIEALKARGLWQSNEPVERTVLVAEYNYTDEYGGLLYQVVRTEPKGFYQRRPDGHGGWINKKNKCQVLYRLREVLEAPIVFVVEGEKDAESLRAHGFVATTNTGGANAPWLPNFTETLRGREVILIPDNDSPGRHRVLKIARALLGHAAQIIVLELEDGKDISEWFDRGHSELELISQVQGREVTP